MERGSWSTGEKASLCHIWQLCPQPSSPSQLTPEQGPGLHQQRSQGTSLAHPKDARWISEADS